MRFWSFGVICAAALMAALPQMALAKGFSNLFVFGDSLVDAGNVYRASGGAYPPAAAGYFDGRFTNGYDYTDLLSIDLYGHPTIPVVNAGSGYANNFAFGGARVVANADPFPDLGAQIAAYKFRTGSLNDPNALYVLNFGGNDVFALGSGDTGGLTAEQYSDALVSGYVAGVAELNSLGARNILITGIPNGAIAAAYPIEAQLQGALDGLVLAPATNLYRYSFLDFFGRTVTDPGSLGLPELRRDTTCLRAKGPSPTIDCTGFFLFDDVHPTAAVQAAAYRDIKRQFGFGAVPEPATWLSMIIGFAAVGWSARRSRRVAAVAAAR